MKTKVPGPLTQIGRDQHGAPCLSCFQRDGLRLVREGQRDQQASGAEFPAIQHNVIGRVPQLIGPQAQGQFRAAQLDNRRYRVSIEEGSARCAATLTGSACGATGSQGHPVVKPASAVPSHCIGVRAGSRPTPKPGTFFSQGSRISWARACYA